MRATIYCTLSLLMLTILPSSQGRSTNVYSIQDLEILEKNKNYTEFFLHARDIVPIKRDRYWNQMIKNMAAGLLNNKIEMGEMTKDDLAYVNRLSKWPELKNDSFFGQKYGNYVVEYLKKCLGTAATLDLKGIAKARGCLQQVEGHRRGPFYEIHTAYKLYRLTTPYFDLNPIPSAHLMSVVSHAEGSVYCNEKQVAHHLLSELGRVKNLAGKIHAKCWQKLIPPYQKMLVENDNHSLTSSLFSLLKKRGALDQGTEDLYLTLFILRGPKVGDIFNLAWNRLKLLSENFSRRSKVLEAITRLDPLPDGFLKSPTGGNSATLTNFIGSNLPEYISHYAKICMSYFEGTRDFPRGNPTPRCRKFLRANKNTALLSDSIKMRYSALKKRHEDL